MESNQNKRPELNRLFESFIKQSRSIEGHSPVTIKNYSQNFNLLKKFKPDIQLDDLTSEFITNFFDFLRTRERKVGGGFIVRDLKNSSVATVRGKLSAFFEWLVKNEYLKANPFNGIKYPDVSYTDKRAFTKEEFDKIYLAVSRDIPWENQLLRKRNIAFIMVLTLTGIRKGEILGLRPSDIDFKKPDITIRAETSKSKRTRSIPITQELMLYLKEYLALVGEYTAESLWVSSNNNHSFTEHGLKHFVNHLNAVTGINCHIHRFRHTFAVNYYRQTHDIVGLQRLMGHRDFNMTLKYLRSLSDDDIAAQMSKFKLARFA